MDRAPSGREFAVLLLSAIAIRALLVVGALLVFHMPILPVSGARGMSGGKAINSFAERSDGSSYVNYARALTGDRSELTDFDLRVFPGLPILLASLHMLGIPFAVAGLAVNWVAAGLAAGFAAMLFRSVRIGWAMVLLIPHYLLFSSMIMNESLLLATITGGLLLLIRRNNAVAAALILGFAGVVRPVACFAVAGALVHLLLQKRWRSTVIVASGSLLVVAGGMLFCKLEFGDPLKSFHVYHDSPYAYRGHMMTWPLHSMLETPRTLPVPVWKIEYVWAHLVVIVVAAIILIARVVQGLFKFMPTAVLDRICLVWLAGNSVFIACVGDLWGFQAFHRFSSWAQPTEFWALLPILPRRWWLWGAIGVASYTLALASAIHN